MAHDRTVWSATAGPRPSAQPLAAARVDVAVVGAGFTGLTAAWHLARRGARVAVLEADVVGSGASGVNAGFVVPNFAKADPAAVIQRLGPERGRRLLDAIGQGADRVFATVRDHGLECDAEPVGWMHVAHAPATLPVLQARAAAWAALGRPVRMLDAAEARALTGARRCAGALFDASGGMLHPLNYLYGLARLAQAAGAVLHEQARVDRIARDGGGWRLAVGGRTLAAEQVLLCTNAAASGAARQLARTVVPLRVYQVATVPLPAALARRIAPGRTPLADTRANLFTLRLTRDNRLISGGMAVVPLGARRRMARRIAARLAAELGLPEPPRIDYAWRGIAAMSPDFLPHIHAFGPGFWGGIGCNGRGIAVTAVLGEALADAAAGVAPADLPIPVAPARPIPFHPLAQMAPSVAIMRAMWADRRSAG